MAENNLQLYKYVTSGRDDCISDEGDEDVFFSITNGKFTCLLHTWKTKDSVYLTA